MNFVACSLVMLKRFCAVSLFSIKLIIAMVATVADSIPDRAAFV